MGDWGRAGEDFYRKLAKNPQKSTIKDQKTGQKKEIKEKWIIVDLLKKYQNNLAETHPQKRWRDVCIEPE